MCIRLQASAHSRHTLAHFFIIGSAASFSHSIEQAKQAWTHASRTIDRNAPWRPTTRLAIAQMSAQSKQAAAHGACSFFPSAMLMVQCE
jgi:hypothetical protein